MSAVEPLRQAVESADSGAPKAGEANGGTNDESNGIIPLGLLYFLDGVAVGLVASGGSVAIVWVSYSSHSELLYMYSEQMRLYMQAFYFFKVISKDFFVTLSIFCAVFFWLLGFFSKFTYNILSAKYAAIHKRINAFNDNYKSVLD